MKAGALLLLALGLYAQIRAQIPEYLPEPSALLAEVKANQQKLDAIRENYTFHMLRRTDQLDKNGSVVKTSSIEREVFFVHGRRIARLVARDGKLLSPAEDAAEQARVMKLVETVLKGGKAKGPPAGNRIGEISDILAVVKISNPRRVVLRDRPSLAYDFTGDPSARSRDLEQNAAKKMSGTIWFDETDHQVARLEVRFDDTFHIGAGILASVQKGSSMEFEQARFGDGLWMPTMSAEHLDARVIGKKLREDTHVANSGFKKFNAEAVERPR